MAVDNDGSPANMGLVAALLARRSVKPRALVMPGPTVEQLHTIAAAGQRAPDHGRLRPWRLIELRDRLALAEAFVAAEVERRELEQRPVAPTEALARAWEKAAQGPCVLALVARIRLGHATLPAHEQWIAVGAALAQMLLAADGLGFAGSILSGRKTETRALHSALSLDAEEKLVGFLTLGTPITSRTSETAPVSRPQDDSASVVSVWPPSTE